MHRYQVTFTIFNIYNDTEIFKIIVNEKQLELLKHFVETEIIDDLHCIPLEDLLDLS